MNTSGQPHREAGSSRSWWGWNKPSSRAGGPPVVPGLYTPAAGTQRWAAVRGEDWIYQGGPETQPHWSYVPREKACLLEEGTLQHRAAGALHHRTEAALTDAHASPGKVEVGLWGTRPRPGNAEAQTEASKSKSHLGSTLLCIPSFFFYFLFLFLCVNRLLHSLLVLSLMSLPLLVLSVSLLFRFVSSFTGTCFQLCCPRRIPDQGRCLLTPLSAFNQRVGGVSVSLCRMTEVEEAGNSWPIFINCQSLLIEFICINKWNK